MENAKFYLCGISERSADELYDGHIIRIHCLSDHLHKFL